MSQFDSDKDYYQVLGADETASRLHIERLYKRLASRCHPDRGGSEEEMKALNEAHDILSDPETRKAYDAERQPRRAVYASSMAFDPEAASKAGTLGIPVTDPDFAGLVMGAIACFGLGIPLLLLVEMQWIFILWPLRIMALGALAVGVYLAHSALLTKQRKLKKAGQGDSRKRVVIRELLFWLIVTGTIGPLLVALYAMR